MARYEQFTVGDLSADTINGCIFPGVIGMGNVYYVADTTSTAFSDISNRLGGKFYADGSAMLYPHTSTSTVVTTNGLKAAAAACITDRNDYIVVLPSTNTYYINELLTLKKKAVHLICPAALVNRVGCTSAARIQQIGAAVSIISIENGGIEVAGFYLKNITGYAHIQVPTTSTCVADGGASAWGISIHNNYFVGRSSSTTLPMLYCTGDGASYSRIENNWFTEQVSNGAYTTGVICVGNTGASTDCIGNYITIGDSCTATYGIYNLAVKSVIADNYFSECGGSGAGATGGTITFCITMGATCSAIGNRCAVASGHFSDGSGTTHVSYTDNTDGITNGGTSGMLGAQLET